MGRRLVMLAAFFGMLGVGMGAFGAHALSMVFKANGREATYQTAVQYHLIHTLALLFVSSAVRRWPGRLAHASGFFFTLGIIFFSGSLYILAIFDLPVMGAVAPIGGVAFILGWLLLGLTAWQNNIA
ncbi:MAG: DUF423 domain-containing protein [Chloroflexi bacterium]|nr:DUF423 domain-containing protein [Chloroflexota bacterium]MCC6895833.1 DUF423 domain-containing protein [Anaerolineae bacterium]